MSNPMTPLDAVRREELRKLAEAATPGPWTWGAELICQKRADDTYKYLAEVPSGDYDSPRWNADAAYIAAMSPDTTLALLAYIAELEAGLRGARERFAQIECKVIDGMLVTTPSKMIEWQKAIASHGFNETSALLPKASVREERE